MDLLSDRRKKKVRTMTWEDLGSRRSWLDNNNKPIPFSQPVFEMTVRASTQYERKKIGTWNPVTHKTTLPFDQTYPSTVRHRPSDRSPAFSFFLPLLAFQRPQSIAIMTRFLFQLVAFACLVAPIGAFVAVKPMPSAVAAARATAALHATKAAPLVTGEELEKIMTEWDQPLVIDAYATW